MSSEFEMRIIEQLTEIRMEISRLNRRIDLLNEDVARIREKPIWEHRV